MTYNIFDRLTLAEALYMQPFETDPAFATNDPFHDRVFLTGFVDSADQINFDIRFENEQGVQAPVVVGKREYFEKPEIKSAIIKYAVEVDQISSADAEAGYNYLIKNLTTRADASADLGNLNNPNQPNKFLEKFGANFPAILGGGYFMVTADRQPLAAQRSKEAPIKALYWGSPSGLADQGLQQAMNNEGSEESFVAEVELGNQNGAPAIFITPQFSADAENAAERRALKTQQFHDLFELDRKNKRESIDENGQIRLSLLSEYAHKVISNTGLVFDIGANPIIVMRAPKLLPMKEKPELMPHRIQVFLNGRVTEAFAAYCRYEDQVDGAESTNTFSMNRVGQLTYNSDQIATFSSAYQSQNKRIIYMEPEFERHTSVGLPPDAKLLASLESYNAFLECKPRPALEYRSVGFPQSGPALP